MLPALCQDDIFNAVLGPVLLLKGRVDIVQVSLLVGGQDFQGMLVNCPRPLKFLLSTLKLGKGDVKVLINKVLAEGINARLVNVARAVYCP